MNDHCPTCGCPVRVEGRTTKYYVPQPELKSRSQIKRVMVQAPAEVIVEIGRLRAQLKVARCALEKIADLTGTCSEDTADIAVATARLYLDEMGEMNG